MLNYVNFPQKNSSFVFVTNNINRGFRFFKGNSRTNCYTRRTASTTFPLNENL